MPHRVIDKRIGSSARKAEAFDRREETFSEYFEPVNGTRKVLRYELLAILTQYHKAKRNSRWWNRLWRNLKSAVGSEPVAAVEQGDMGITVTGKPVLSEEERTRLSVEP